MAILLSVLGGILAGIIFELFVLGILQLIGFYVCVPEAQALVFTLFGKVVAVIDRPGLHLLWFNTDLLWRAPIINFFGKVYRVDCRLDQRYLRSQPVNSEEGAPMGIGIWYEMFVSDPVAYLFQNTDPRGSLAANVSNSVVRCLSNMPLGDMLGNRHSMSQSVRSEVSAKSKEWGYSLGSVYIRKVHFRDDGMTKQIESKVVNQLRQVTAAIRQDGENQVNIITGTAQRTAATEFAKAAAIRPKVIGELLQQIAQDPPVAQALFDVLEAQKMLASKADITIVPQNDSLLTSLLASTAAPAESAPKVAGAGLKAQTGAA